MLNHTYFISAAETARTVIRPRASLWVDELATAHLATTTDIIGKKVFHLNLLL